MVGVAAMNTTRAFKTGATTGGVPHRHTTAFVFLAVGVAVDSWGCSHAGTSIRCTKKGPHRCVDLILGMLDTG